MEEATSENLMAGSAMIRRATYMYGTFYQRMLKDWWIQV